MIIGLELAADNGAYSSTNLHSSPFKPFYAAAGAALATGTTGITHADSGVFTVVPGFSPLVRGWATPKYGPFALLNSPHELNHELYNSNRRHFLPYLCNA